MNQDNNMFNSNDNVTNQTINNSINNNQYNQQPVSVETPPISNNGSGVSNSNNSDNKSKKTLIIVLAIVGGLIALFVIAILAVVLLFQSGSQQLVCKSEQGSITILYNDNSLTGYKSNGISYDLDQQKAIAERIGVDVYIIQFNNWFTANTTGSCSINGKVLEKGSISSDNSNTPSSDELKTIGNTTYGYVDVPKNWMRFQDVDGNDSLQYSSADGYIVTLNILDRGYSAKEYATNYMQNKQNSDEVTKVTGATVKIGKNEEYTAYQVHMYYPSENEYLVTYFFDTEDGQAHYIAVEGADKLADYLFIPKSFRLSDSSQL